MSKYLDERKKNLFLSFKTKASLVLSLGGKRPTPKENPHMTRAVVHHDRRERGATAVEYGVLAGLIAFVIIVAVTALGGRLNALFLAIAGVI